MTSPYCRIRAISSSGTRTDLSSSIISLGKVSSLLVVYTSNAREACLWNERIRLASGHGGGKKIHNNTARLARSKKNCDKSGIRTHARRQRKLSKLVN